VVNGYTIFFFDFFPGLDVMPFLPPPAQMASVLDKTERGHLDVPRAICKAQYIQLAIHTIGYYSFWCISATKEPVQQYNLDS